MLAGMLLLHPRAETRLGEGTPRCGARAPGQRRAQPPGTCAFCGRCCWRRPLVCDAVLPDATTGVSKVDSRRALGWQVGLRTLLGLKVSPAPDSGRGYRSGSEVPWTIDLLVQCRGSCPSAASATMGIRLDLPWVGSCRAPVLSFRKRRPARSTSSCLTDSVTTCSGNAALCMRPEQTAGQRLRSELIGCGRSRDALPSCSIALVRSIRTSPS